MKASSYLVLGQDIWEQVLTQIQKWLKYCQGENYTPNEFNTLLMEATDKDVDTIFSSLEMGQEIKDRLKRVLHIKGHENLTHEEILEIVKDDIYFKKNIISKIDGEEKAISVIKTAEKNYSFVNSSTFEDLEDDESLWDDEISSIINLKYIYSIKPEYKRVVSALENAIREISSDTLIWYVLAPYTKNIFKEYNSYIKLWEMGVDYIITEKGIYIHLIPEYKSFKTTG